LDRAAAAQEFPYRTGYLVQSQGPKQFLYAPS
jgi:hypothetical protein